MLRQLSSLTQFGTVLASSLTSTSALVNPIRIFCNSSFITSKPLLKHGTFCSQFISTFNAKDFLSRSNINFNLLQLRSQIRSTLKISKDVFSFRQQLIALCQERLSTCTTTLSNLSNVFFNLAVELRSYITKTLLTQFISPQKTFSFQSLTQNRFAFVG